MDSSTASSFTSCQFSWKVQNHPARMHVRLQSSVFDGTQADVGPEPPFCMRRYDNLHSTSFWSVARAGARGSGVQSCSQDIMASNQRVSKATYALRQDPKKNATRTENTLKRATLGALSTRLGRLQSSSISSNPFENSLQMAKCQLQSACISLCMRTHHTCTPSARHLSNNNLQCSWPFSQHFSAHCIPRDSARLSERALALVLYLFSAISLAILSALASTSLMSPTM